MKRLFAITCLVLAVFVSSFSQVMPGWVKELNDLQSEVTQYSQSKDWRRASTNLDRTEKLFYSRSAEECETYFYSKDIGSSFYYNAACYSSLAGKASKALRCFEKYTQYVTDKKTEANLYHINTDTGLNPIRNHKRFVACMDKIKQYGDYIQKLKTFSAYANGTAPGTMLSISEVRARLREGKELRLNDCANWNHKIKQTKEDYLNRYMAKICIPCHAWKRADTMPKSMKRDARTDIMF